MRILEKEQYEKYKQIEEGLKPIKNFLYWSGKKYKNKSVSLYRFSLKRLGKKFGLYIHRNWSGIEENIFDLPIELQDRIIETVEKYVEEKEQKMKNI